jgi:hypothetical protein
MLMDTIRCGGPALTGPAASKAASASMQILLARWLRISSGP